MMDKEIAYVVKEIKSLESKLERLRVILKKLEWA